MKPLLRSLHCVCILTWVLVMERVGVGSGGTAFDEAR